MSEQHDEMEIEEVTRGRPWVLSAFVTLVAIGGVSAVALVWSGTRELPLSGPSHATLAVLVAFLFLGETKTLKWLKLHDGGEITASWAFAFALALLPAPTVALLAMATASAVGDLVHRKPLQRVVFNAGQTTVSLAVAIALLVRTGQIDAIGSGEPLTVLWFVTVAVAASSMFLVNGLLTCIAMALHEGTSVMLMLRRGLFLNFVSDGALVVLAPIFLVVADRSVLLLPLVITVAVLVHFNTRTALASEHEATHDALTELWNRRAFMSRFAAELDRRPLTNQCALALIDLDDFKEINDRLGHHMGDSVLAEVGARLTALGHPGQITARLGGDEFAVLFTRVSGAEEAAALAEQVRAAITRPYHGGGFPITAAGSVGVSIWPEHGNDESSMMQAADLAMYRAKASGNAVHVYEESANVVAAGRIDLLAELERCIAQGELVVWYQPQIDLATGTPVAFEALVRWQHPRHGLVMPGDFMPLAEHTDLIAPLTEYVLRRSVQDAQRWQLTHPGVHVAVNASARNLVDLSFPKTVAAVLEAYEYPADLLELEITENTVLTQPQRVAAILDAIENLGVRLSIDDFGTGYSSLSRLREMPVGTIKIDRSFVTGLAQDEDDLAIVRGIIDLAASLGLSAVAEGVETEEVAALLRGLGCDMAQGYLIARPMPFEDALRWLHRVAPVFGPYSSGADAPQATPSPAQSETPAPPVPTFAPGHRIHSVAFQRYNS